MAEQKDIKIINEIVNDAFWLSFILEIKRNLTDYNQKELLSCFLLVFASIFCDETITAGYGDYHYVTEDEMEFVREYQKKYIDNVTNVFNNHISINFGMPYEISLCLAKIQKWASGNK